MVDCDNCKNSGTHCNECEHYWDLENYYSPMTAAEIAEKEEKVKQDIFLSIPSDLIAVELAEATIEAFKVAKEYTRVDPGKYNWLPSVYFGVNCLVATDQYRLIEIKEVEVPEHLLGSHILEIDAQRGIARVMREPGPNPLSSGSYKEVIDESTFTKVSTCVNQVKEVFEPSDEKGPGGEELVVYTVEGIEIYIRKDWNELALSHFKNEVEFWYKEKHNPIAFTDNKITVIILPVRISEPIRY